MDRAVTTERLELDYIASPRHSRWIGLLLLAVALFITADLLLRYRDARLALQRYETARGLLAEERRPSRAIPKDRLEEHTRAAQSVIRQLALPWAAIVQAVEAAGSQDVAVLQLQPDAQQALFRLTAEARGSDQMLEYLRQLAATPGLSEVHLISHQVREDDPQRPVQFTLQASFRGRS